MIHLIPNTQENTRIFNGNSMETPLWLCVIGIIIFFSILLIVFRYLIRKSRSLINKPVTLKALVFEKRTLKIDSNNTGYYITFKSINNDELIDLKVSTDVYNSLKHQSNVIIKYKGNKLLFYKYV
jgi:hypothetical protein